MTSYHVYSYYFLQSFYVINKTLLKAVVLLQEICEEMYTAFFCQLQLIQKSTILLTSFKLKNKFKKK